MEKNKLRYTIKHKITGKTLFECDADSFVAAIRQAIDTKANLCEADLCGADLRGANLRGANLRGADLRRANLYVADLRGADLCEANLYVADLRGADLRRADLRGADLCEANLYVADLRRADLRGADLCGADLRRADLRRTNLRYANLDFASWPLWCGSIGVKVDLKLASQLAYHLAAVDCDAPEFLAIRPHLLSLANKSHVVTVYGLPELTESISQEMETNEQLT
jgi:uncharacterized protein YjbI with pentapeptide repeats